MLNQFLNFFPISASADHADGSFTVNIKPLEIKGDDVGINNKIEQEALKGKFRLMNGNVYRVINDEPQASELLKVSEQIDLTNAGNDS